MESAVPEGNRTRLRAPDPGRKPAVEPACLALLPCFDTLGVRRQLAVQALDIDAEMLGTIVLERGQRLHEQVAGAASAAALEAQVQRSGHLNEPADKLLVALLRYAPELLPDLVGFEIDRKSTRLNSSHVSESRM